VIILSGIGCLNIYVFNVTITLSLGRHNYIPTTS